MSAPEKRKLSLYSGKGILVGLILFISSTLVWAAANRFEQLSLEFQESAVKDFVRFTIKGERYPLQHALSELRYRVFAEKLGINRKVETKACSFHRTYGAEIPADQQKFCKDYDSLVDLAKKSVIQFTLFEKIYLDTEKILLREIEKNKARDPMRIWIRQKRNCLNDQYRCGRDEKAMLMRITGFDAEIHKMYDNTLLNLEKKLFPEEQKETFIKLDDLETRCQFVGKGVKYSKTMGMTKIPASSFKMGTVDGSRWETPQHEVKLDEFWIDNCEVTNLQYLQVVSQHPFLRKSTFSRKFHDGSYLKDWKDDLVPPLGRELHPVMYVSWYAARHFCNYLGKRLPSEAEWEMATRAGTESPYAFEGGVEFLRDYGWYRENSGGIPHTAAQKMANPSGLFDLHGNVWEWVYDWFGKYSAVSATNPQGPEIGKYRVMRGGSWSDPAENLRSAQRRDALGTSTYNNVGFRCVTN